MNFHEVVKYIGCAFAAYFAAKIWVKLCPWSKQ